MAKKFYGNVTIMEDLMKNQTTNYDAEQFYGGAYPVQNKNPASKTLLLVHEFGVPFLALITFILRILCIIVYSKPLASNYARGMKNSHSGSSSIGGATTGCGTGGSLSNGCTGGGGKHKHGLIFSSSYNIINRYLRVNSFAEAYVSFSYIFLPIAYCRTICFDSRSFAYFSKFYYVYMVTYGSNLASMIAMTANLFLCAYRYMLIFNKKKFLPLISSRYFVVFLILVCFIINMPYLFSTKIESSETEVNETKFRLVETRFIKSRLGVILKDACAFIRYILLTVSFLIINLILFYSSWKYAKKRQDLLKINSKNCVEIILERNHVLPSNPGSSFLDHHDEHDYESDEEEARGAKSGQPVTLALTNLNKKTAKRKNSSKKKVNYRCDEYMILHQSASGSSPVSSHHSPIKIIKSDEWNLTKMTLFIGVIYLVNLILVTVSLIFSRLDLSYYDAVIILDLIAVYFVQITSLFEIASYFLFNKFFLYNFKCLMDEILNLFNAKFLFK